MNKRFISIYDINSVEIIGCDNKDDYKRVHITTHRNRTFQLDIQNVFINQLMLATKSTEKVEDVAAEILHKNKIDICIDAEGIVFSYKTQKEIEKEIISKLSYKLKRIGDTIYCSGDFSEGVTSSVKQGMKMEEVYEFDKACDRFFNYLEIDKKYTKQ